MPWPYAHNCAFTQQLPHTYTLLITFTDGRFHPQKLLHTEVFTLQSFSNTESFSQTEGF